MRQDHSCTPHQHPNERGRSHQPPPLDPRFEAGFQLARRAEEAHRQFLHDQWQGLVRLELLSLKADLAALQRDLARRRDAAPPPARKYSPDQPRLPAGQSGGGQWTGGGVALTSDFGSLIGPEGGGEALSFASYTWGRLIAEFETGFGRRCVYQFDFGAIVMPGPIIGRCWDRMLPSGASHGYFLNDNWRM